MSIIGIMSVNEPAVLMRFCKTCRHWETSSGVRTAYHFGRCAASREMHTAAEMFCSKGGALVTSPDFGCVLHEPKDGGS